MSETPSTMLALGTPAPEFVLPDVVSGSRVRPRAAAGPSGLLVAFLCRHCPYAVNVQGEVARVARDYRGRGIGTVGVASNDAGQFPDDGPDGLRAQAGEAGFEFPYLYDEDQEVAKAFTAACTPDFFLFDGGLKLVYRGQLDESRPGNGREPDGRHLREAIEALLAGKPPVEDQRPSLGCNIKWKKGREPSYYRR